MAKWITPVFDRTQDDVEFASQKIAEWIAGEIIGTSYMVTDLKGCLNVSDINRIEGNIAYLAENLTTYCYPANVVTKTWALSSMPTATDVARITDNVKALVSAYYQSVEAPAVPNSMMSYSDINDIEQNLHLIKQLLDAMVRSFKSAHSFTSGTKMFLPRSRVVNIVAKMATISDGSLLVSDPSSIGYVVEDILTVKGENSNATIIDDVLYVT